MKRLILLILVLTALPANVFALEQSFTRQGLKATVRLSPEKLEQHADVQLSLRLELDGKRIEDKDVRLAVYQRGSGQPLVNHRVELLDDEYVDSWQFEQAGDYRVVVRVEDPQRPEETMEYEIEATVAEAGHDHGMFSHHSGSWKLWGMGAMMLIMVPMMIIAL